LDGDEFRIVGASPTINTGYHLHQLNVKYSGDCPKGFKYRFFPTDEQAAQLAKTFGCARYVYNQALEFRSTAWQLEKKSIGYHTTAAKLTEWKKEPEKAFLSEVSLGTATIAPQSRYRLHEFLREASAISQIQIQTRPPIGALFYECLRL
jgi:hypothetical protein